MNRRQAGVADDLLAEWQHAVQDAVAAVHLDAQEAGVGDGVDDVPHESPPPTLARVKGLPDELAPSMNVPRQLAKGSVASLS